MGGTSGEHGARKLGRASRYDGVQRLGGTSGVGRRLGTRVGATHGTRRNCAGQDLIAQCGCGR